MKTIFLFISMALYGLCFGAFALSGCDDCCPVHSVFNAQIKNGAPVPATIYLSSAGERYVFDLNCTMPWMVLADLPGSWLDVSPMNDPNGSREVTITVPVNPARTSRSHTITFLAANGDRWKITVIQNGINPFARIINLKGVNMIYIPGATYTMGSPVSEPGRQSDEDQHLVTLSDFFISECVITNALYCLFLNETGVPETAGGGGAPSFAQGNVAGYGNQLLVYENSSGVHYFGGSWEPQPGYGNYPVIHVTWFGAKAFCDWAGGRLPTEAEWEYACRAGTSTRFNTGDDITGADANFGGGGGTTPIRSFAPNGYGLYDTHGNVAEWCVDWYDNYNTSAVSNPSGPGAGTERIIRGGSYIHINIYCRSAYRLKNVPEYTQTYIGFRMASATP